MCRGHFKSCLLREEVLKRVFELQGIYLQDFVAQEMIRFRMIIQKSNEEFEILGLNHIFQLLFELYASKVQVIIIRKTSFDDFRAHLFQVTEKNQQKLILE
jgi:hypothetical protein